MRRAGYLLPAIVAACLTLGAIAVFLSGPLRTAAVQNPRLSLDMDPMGNGYDPASNTMTVSGVDGCLVSSGGNSSTHTHTAHVVVENIEDLVGWQARLNYNGDNMRPTNIDFHPYLDATTEQQVSFLNLPKEVSTGRHRDVVSADTGITEPGSKTRSFGSAYLGTQTAPISPDTPSKNPSDDSSYSALAGGVLATIDLEVMGDQTGRTLFMQLDDSNPTPPGSGVAVFDGTEGQAMELAESDLGSGYHAEGADGCSAVPTPTNGPATSTPTSMPPFPPKSGPLADVRVAGIEIQSPDSVAAGQRFSIHLTTTVVNGGPEAVDTQVLASYGWDARLECRIADNFKMFWDVGYLDSSASANLDISNDLTCYGTSSEVTSGTFYLGVTAYSISGGSDPDPENNSKGRQANVSVIGRAPVPTASPVGGGPTPSPGPFEPT